jgi:NAD(P)-dependent dehydrogenase (short-subunit alcohol dehydrogenase family)
MKKRVLLCGGYGTFGYRAVERLGRDAELEIIIAGRNLASAEQAVATIQPRLKARLSAAVVDATRPDLAVLRSLAPNAIYNASGPYQNQDYSLACAAIAVGAHYVDLADAREFVAGIHVLDVAAKAAGVLVVSGASTVPALSSAVIDHYVPSFDKLTAITYGIAPANGFDPGVATTASILSSIGKPFETLRNGRNVRVHGWQGLWQHRFPEIGTRHLAACDIPDLALFPARYPNLCTITFGAGLEVSAMHFAMWGLSWVARCGLLSKPERLAKPLLALKPLFRAFGSDAGGMFMLLDGIGPNGKRKRVAWHVIARQNHGPLIPQTPATILTRKLLSGALTERGAMPCLGLMSLAEFDTEVSDLSVVTSVSINTADEPVAREHAHASFD